MSFPSHPHGQLNACIAGALRGALQLRSAQADCAHQTVDDVLQVARAVESVVRTSFLQFYSDWNAAHRDIVLRLPRELSFECFRHLDFTGRRAITHVSRAWRRLALSDVRLWNSVVLARDPLVALDMLATFLHRSNPMPFAVTSKDTAAVVAGAVLGLIIEHIHRMESIEFAHLLPDDVLDLFSKKTQILKTLVVNKVFNGSFVLPEDWGQDKTPFLETLELGRFRVPTTFQPITTLRTFTGSLHDGLPDSLFTIFPNITSLNLKGIEQGMLSSVGLLPASVTRLSLRCAPHQRFWGLDYSPLLPTLARLDLSYLYLSSASTLASIVQLFIEKTQGERRMAITWRGVLELESDAPNVRFEIHALHSSVSIPAEPAILTPLRSFSTLSMPLEVLLGIDRCLGQGDRTLSSVQSLNIIIDWLEEYDHLRVVDEPGTTPLSIPHLQSLSLEAHFYGFDQEDDILEQFASWLGRDLAAALPLLLSYPASNVEFITMKTNHPDLLLQCGTRNLRRLAPRLKIRNLRTLEVTELQDGERDESTL